MRYLIEESYEVVDVVVVKMKIHHVATPYTVPDVFVEAGKYAARIEDPSALKHWLITATVRAARYRLRRARFAAM